MLFKCLVVSSQAKPSYVSEEKSRRTFNGEKERLIPKWEKIWMKTDTRSSEGEPSVVYRHVIRPLLTAEKLHAHQIT